MKFIFRGIVSVLIALCILLTSALIPSSAYADGLNGLGSSSTHSVSSLNVKGNHNSITINNSLRSEDYKQNEANRFVDSMIDGATQTLGYAAGAALVCYTADGLASTVFPPAVALAPACSVIPGLFVGAKGAQLGVQGTKAVLKAAIVK
ncbi:MAG: hypothetical protein OHK0047_32380 [Leptolyngbyaceae cyanobacterium]